MEEDIFRTYYTGVIGGNSARRFKQEIGFCSARKQQKLEAICAQVNNTNVEGIPASDLVAEAVEQQNCHCAISVCIIRSTSMVPSNFRVTA